MTVKPYAHSATGKKEQVKTMFDSIALKYDLLNKILSAGIDKAWRKKLVKLLSKNNPQLILDVATGTADLAIAVSSLKPQKITGIDISPKMLQIGEKKIKKMHLEEMIDLKVGDAENLPFTENMFDAVCVAFGVRNYENLEVGLKEINRVLKPGGEVFILEFSRPQVFPVKQIYNFYSKRILPVIGKKISGDDSAYKYLPDSVNAFPYGNNFLNILSGCGFTQNKLKSLTFGIASIYMGKKN
ncbi:MAG TPA: bifunctional demethylmenaquinone methyltransferase/2-methoxy-6-polyprenyl-1,4-benzoquinol methylase UbiE [Bacteroidia bacterium]|nr:bifunctional demethylmenaquinone methyltransferase/2-methoxy-6-polyprenyl-1,4-benzoquinol methylase UbiE [Bacteroidia bacterium]HNU34291.1 bifunctional demethylmenaquinone methyltransferase/2-methoxy-6-polyprenyl-1,4-benzoquinol methylase UbiE [Bacteroidia bacterium]